ncbi:hypothetical protein [Pyruvatibacter sp.]
MISAAFEIIVVFLFLAVFAVSVSASAFQVWRSVAGRFRGDAWRIDFYFVAIVACVLQFIPVVIWLDPALVGQVRELGADELTSELAGFIPAVISAVIATVGPIALPVARAFATARIDKLTYVFSAASIIALPFALVLVTLYLSYLAATITQTPADYLFMFSLQTDFPACRQTLIDFIGLPVPQTLAAVPSEAAALLWFWVDMSLAAILLDFMEIYGCGVSYLSHDSDSFLVSTLVFAYRSFASVMFAAVLLMPVRQMLAARADTGESLS